MLFFVILFFLLSAISDSVMDILQFHYSNSIFKKFKNNLFWDPSISWRNKYKDGDPQKGPKFFLSNTLFVGVTDAWHFFKLLRNLFIFSSVFTIFYMFLPFYHSLLLTVMLRVVFGIGFTIFYKYLQSN
jgi:hypothetical protein